MESLWAGVTRPVRHRCGTGYSCERLDQQQQLASLGVEADSSQFDQALFTPDSGSTSSAAGDIGSDITSFFDTFSSLEANPSDNALRQSVLSKASTLAGDVSNAAASLNSQRSALDQEAAGVTSQVNSLTSAIAQLNQQIQSTSPMLMRERWRTSASRT